MAMKPVVARAAQAAQENKAKAKAEAETAKAAQENKAKAEASKAAQAAKTAQENKAKAKAEAETAKAKQVDDTKAKAAAVANKAKPYADALKSAVQAKQAQAQTAKAKAATAKPAPAAKPDAPPSFSPPPEMRGMVGNMIKQRMGAGQQQAPTQTNNPYDMDQAAYNAMIQRAKANQGAGPTAPMNQDRLQALQGMLKGLPTQAPPPMPRNAPPTMGGMGAMARAPQTPMQQPLSGLGDAVRGMGVGFGMKKGGAVKAFAKGGKVSSASSRADGIAQRGKTKGKIL